MKKYIVLIVAVLLCAGMMFGCSSPKPAAPAETAPSTDAGQAEAAESGGDQAKVGPLVQSTSNFQGVVETSPLPGADQLTIGYSGIGAFEVSWVQLGLGVRTGIEFHGAKFKDYNPATRFDLAEQIAQIENAIADGVDALIIAPCDGSALTSVVNKAQDAGIPVVSMNMAIEGPTVSCHVANDDYGAGVESAEYMAEKVNYEGNVVLLAGNDLLKSGRDRRVGYRETVAKYPNMTLVVDATTDWDPGRAQDAMVAALDKYDKIAGVFSCWDGGALAGYQAIIDAGRESDGMVLGGVDSYNDALILIYEGTIFKTDIYKDLTFQGYITAETAVKVALGMPVPEYIDSGSMMLTTENIRDWMAQYGITSLEQKGKDEEALAAQYQ